MSVVSIRLPYIDKHIFPRIANSIRSYASYALSLFGSVHIAHAPLFVSVEPANFCQLRCPECPVGNGNSGISKGVMSRDVWQRTLNEITQTVWTIQFYFQGEPLLNNNLSEMIHEAHEKSIYTIVSTNAQAMTPEMAEKLISAGLNRIIISMDGLTPETYNAYRVGGNLEMTKAALRYLREVKERLHGHTIIELQCLRLRTNEHEWEVFRREYKLFGADCLSFKTAQLYNYENGHPLMPSNLRYSRYVRGKDGLFRLRSRRKSCLRVWTGCVVTTTGEVLPCCYDKAHAHSFGNIMDAPLYELFTNDTALAFRRAAIKEEPEICQQCWK